MTAKIHRDVKVIAGPLIIEPRTVSGENQPLLRMRFDVTKTNNREPNTAKLTIWNLAEDSRSKLQSEDLEVIIEAGYVDELVQIFKGDLETATTTKESVNWMTELELGDGSTLMQSSRINEGFRGGQAPGAILKKAAAALGLDAGNIDEKVSADGARSVLKQFINNVILSGKTTDVLDEVAASLGLNYSVQDKSLQLLAKGESLSDPAVPLSVKTGLIGSPKIGEKGVISVESLMNGVMKPGRKIDLDSVALSGAYIAQKVQHVGDTWGPEWITAMEMVAE